jgi:CRISPR-associated endoribonuclease Cas6
MQLHPHVQLISIILALETNQSASLPRHLGRANYAATLACLQEMYPGLAMRLHSNPDTKPITCSGLFDAHAKQEQYHVTPGKAYLVRITGLDSEVSQALYHSLMVARPAVWVLNGHEFPIIGSFCDVDNHNWSGHTTYQSLAAMYALRDSSPSRHITLEFSSPTSFRSRGVHLPLPLPSLVFGSLADRWNQFSPVKLDSTLRTFSEEMVGITRYRIESRLVPYRNTGSCVGGIGCVTYVVLDNAQYWLNLLNLLAEFALYSGVGINTAIGMGQVRRSSKKDF